MIKIYYGRYQEIGIDKITSTNVLKRISEVTIEKSQKQKINAYYFLLQEIKKINNDYDISFDNYGKPYIANNPLYISLTHSDDYFAFAISSQEIGIDMEKERDYSIEKLKQLSQKYFLEKINNNKSFIKYWTVKESYLKLLGIGLRTSLKDVIIINDTVSLKKQKKAYYESIIINNYRLSFSTFEKDGYTLIDIKEKASVN